MTQDLLDHFGLGRFDEGDDLHFTTALCTEQGIDLIDPLDEHGPGLAVAMIQIEIEIGIGVDIDQALLPMLGVDFDPDFDPGFDLDFESDASPDISLTFKRNRVGCVRFETWRSEAGEGVLKYSEVADQGKSRRWREIRGCSERIMKYAG